MGLKLRENDLNHLQKWTATKEGSVVKIRAEDLTDNNKITICCDEMFRTLFQRDEYIKFPCRLLSYIIDTDYEYLLHHLSFDTTEKGKEEAKEGEEFGYRNDLVAVIDEDKVLVEMNNNESEEYRERNLSYLMRYREVPNWRCGKLIS